MAKKHKINFEGVDAEIRKHTERAARVPEGDYIVKVVKGDFRENEDTGSTGFNWRCQIVSPEKYKGKTVYGYTSLKTEALWNLRNLINAAMGKNVAGKSVNFDPDSIVGKVVGAAIEDNENPNTGKIGSRINTFFPKSEAQLPSEADEDDDEDEDEEVEDEDEDDEDEDLEEVEVEDI